MFGNGVGTYMMVQLLIWMTQTTVQLAEEAGLTIIRLALHIKNRNVTHPTQTPILASVL